MNKVIYTIIFLLFASSVNAANTGPFTSTIKQLQAAGIGDPYNTVFLNIDITASPCADTNLYDRFNIINNAQMSAVLAAVMANKEITIYGTGTCNASGVETLRLVIVKP